MIKLRVLIHVHLVIHFYQFFFKVIYIFYFKLLDYYLNDSVSTNKTCRLCSSVLNSDCLECIYNSGSP